MLEECAYMDYKQTIQVTILTLVLTLAINSIFHYLKSKLDWFVDTKKFKREHSYSQLKNLYLGLYAIICQSEYLRFFYDIKESHAEVPFLEMSKRKEIKKHTFDFNNVYNEPKNLYRQTGRNKLELSYG